MVKIKAASIENSKKMSNIDSLFPFGSPRIRSYENYVLVSSMVQDGGNWTVIVDDKKYPRIILYAEGWFSHWQPYAGNIRIKKSFLQQILNAG
jgi:hypothetical protein